MVRGMAVHAAHVVLVVFRPREIHLLFAGRMARHAALIDCLRALLLEAEDLCHIHGVRDMCRPRSMASFATLMRRAAARVEHGLVVRRFLEAFV